MENRQLAEKSIIKYVSQIPEVESVYKHDDNGRTAFVVIIDSPTFQWDVHTQIYGHEYDLYQQFPDVDLTVQCVPALWCIHDDCTDHSTRVYRRVGN